MYLSCLEPIHSTHMFAYMPIQKYLGSLRNSMIFISTISKMKYINPCPRNEVVLLFTYYSTTMNKFVAASQFTEMYNIWRAPL